MKKPKRTTAKRLVGAPPYVLAVHDFGTEGIIDRFTVVLGWPFWEEKMRRRVPYLSLSAYGGSCWGELDDISQRQGCGKLIDWKDLPERAQKEVINRANYPDEVVMVNAVWSRNCWGKMAWILVNHDGINCWGSESGYRSKAAVKAYCDEKLICVLSFRGRAAN